MIKPEEVEEYAKQKENENLGFRAFLKNHADETKLDEQFAKLHKEIFESYDCSQCRRCCKKYHGSIPEADIAKDAEILNMSKNEFVEKYLKPDDLGIDYITKHKPCDFLQEDGSCLLGDNKPENCKDYPYTNKPERLWSLLSMLETLRICPASCEIWERLKNQYGFKTKKR